MSITVSCAACGRHLKVKDDFRGKKVKCLDCGAAITVPGGAEPDRPQPYITEVQPAVPRAVSDTGVQAAVPRPAGQVAACPRCNHPLSAGAVICIECGFNLKTGKQLKTVRQRFERRWNTGGIPYIARLAIFAAQELLCLPLFLGVDSPESLIVIGILFGVWTVFWLFVWSYLVQITIAKNEQGELTLTRKTWFCFAPIATKRLDLGEYKDIRLSHESGGLNVAVLLVLFFCFPVVLAALYLVLFLLGWAGGTYTLKIGGEPTLEPELVYRGISEARMKDIAETLQSVAGFRYG
jgi:hypothetical protein